MINLFFLLSLKIVLIFLEAELPLLRNAGPIIPQPEAAIENSVCRERLLKHIQRCQALIDARLDSIEAQVAGE